MIDPEAFPDSISIIVVEKSETSAPQHSRKKFLLGINRIKRKQKYFKKAQKIRKTIRGEPQVKGHSTKPNIAYLSSNGTLVVRLQIKDFMVSNALIDDRSEVNITFRRTTVRISILNEVNSRKSIVRTPKGTTLNPMETIHLMVQAKP